MPIGNKHTTFCLQLLMSVRDWGYRNGKSQNWSIHLWFVSYYNTRVHSQLIHFQFKMNEKIARWHCGTKISKTNLKTMASPLLTSPQGCQGCQKIWKTKLKTTGDASIMEWNQTRRRRRQRRWAAITGSYQPWVRGPRLWRPWRLFFFEFGLMTFGEST